jgi:CysZ protein
MLLFIAGFYVFAVTGKQIVNERLLNLFGIKAWLERMDSGVLSFIFSFTGLVVWLVGLLFYFSLFKYFWLIVGSPVFAWLSEKTESLISGRQYNFSAVQFLKDMARGAGIAGRNLLWQTVYLIALFFLSLIPFIGWGIPFFALLIEAYYFGFSMLDYSFERKGKSAGSTVRFISLHKGLAMGNGMVFYAMHALPVIGWVLAPAYAVIAATITMADVNAPDENL